jgi:hypothetical protein
MNLILFLGSGISIPSGHPDVVTLTDSILNSETNHSETVFLSALRDYDGKARLIGGTYTSQDKYIETGELYRNYTSYEDLYYLCDEISLFHWGLHNNAMIPAFMESLAEEFTPFLNANSKKDKLLEIGKHAQAAKIYINKAIIETLADPGIISGLDLIVELANAPEITSLNILTLNHDLLVEDLLIRNGIHFADGFGSADGDVRWFEPDTFLSDSKVKLIKLHGSVDWYSFLVDGYEKVGKISIGNFKEPKNLSGKTLQFMYKSPNVLSGLNKMKYYNYGMHTDIHYHFQRILYQNTIMIMSGYGWGDDPINNRLMTWLDKKRENRLILLHEKPDLLMERSMVFDRDYSNWVKLEKLKPILKWLCDTSLKEVLEASL